MGGLRAVITVGISASGKTTYAKSLDNGWVNINRDDLRFAITGANGWGEYKFNKSVEEMVTNLQVQMVKQARDAGKNIVISDTNLNFKTRTGWGDRLKHLGYKVEVKHFTVKLEEAWKRDTMRAFGVGREVIYNQWLKYNEQFGYTYTPDKELPLTAVFDIDGTIARMGSRSPFDWTRVGEDSLREEVIIYLKSLRLRGYSIILLSGRDSCCRALTEEWLKCHCIPYQGLFMRPEGDNRPDTEVKEELFRNYLANNYNVQVVVDDRPCMIRTWNRIKIPNVVSVADPYKEF